MIATIELKGGPIKVNLANPIDLSMIMAPKEDCVRAWYVGPIQITPVVTEEFIGDVNQGGSVNFRNISFNPHGNGTHTECVGHISKETYHIGECLVENFFLAQLITVKPQEIGQDLVILEHQFKGLIKSGVKAVIIRTLPNNIDKKRINYSASNPAYLEVNATRYLRDSGIDHLLIDLPSVDREEDEGKLLSHHAFWEYPNNVQKHRTITELIYVPNEVKDGLFFLNLVTANFENDASPSRPVIFSLL